MDDKFLNHAKKIIEPRTFSKVIGSIFGYGAGLGAFSMALAVPAIIAAPALTVIFGAYALIPSTAYIGSKIGEKIYESIKSDVWNARTERRPYKALPGHVIIADPTY